MRGRVGRRRGASQRKSNHFFECGSIVACSLLLAFIIWVILIVQFSLNSKPTSFQSESNAVALTYISSESALWGANDLINMTLESNLIKPDWSHPIIHIVDTRFMQHQPHLIHLARSRFELFKTFCLPTMINQTLSKMYQNNIPSDTQEKLDPYFLWIIKVDPLLGTNASFAPDVLDAMIELLSPYDNFFLVASNDNYGLLHSKGYGWKVGISGASILLNPKARVLTGNISILQRAHHARQHRIILETRLDADDGLNIHYLEMIQRDALEYLSSPLSLDSNKDKDTHKRASWMFWCTSTQLEWRPTNINEKGTHGSINHRREKSFCATPGLSRGVAVGNVTINLASYAHHELFHNVRAHGKCGLKDRNGCLKLVSIANSSAAIRARTVTSVGMDRVDVGVAVLQPQNMSKETSIDVLQMQEPWKGLMVDFSIDFKSIVQANTYMLSNAKSIAEDNLKGQCTKGHSCKKEAKFLLRKIIKNLM